MWQQREKFVQSVRNIENSKRIVGESILKNEFLSKNNEKGDDLGIGSYVAYSSGENENGKKLIRKRSFSDLSQEQQSLEEGYGYNLANEIVSELSKKRSNVFFQPENGRLDITSPKIVSAEIEIAINDENGQGAENKNFSQEGENQASDKIEKEDFTQSQLVLSQKE